MDAVLNCGQVLACVVKTHPGRHILRIPANAVMNRSGRPLLSSPTVNVLRGPQFKRSYTAFRVLDGNKRASPSSLLMPHDRGIAQSCHLRYFFYGHHSL